MSFNTAITFKEKSVICIVLFASLIIRLLFFTGPLGSDEVTYTASAARILAGDWSVSSYNGATRYGVNLPVAGFMWLFGANEHSANAWALVTSLIEIIIVMHLGMAIWDKRAGLFASLLLAFLPLHVHYAGRAMADPPLALFISLGFYLFYWAERT
ncbi:MAG TPA: phospholipid carrier-dependent glycosyltransferase, partial [Alphaproteobacteria bacterium]|nr:phospholipid carrier-dependent glycosyltransferase [Alphaproteobacteria bacterium]